MAAAQPHRATILVIDEVDSLARSRGGSNAGGTSKTDVLNVLLGLIGGASDVSNLFIVGCTNFKGAIDNAFLRCGRIELHYFLGKLPPSERHIYVRRMLFDLGVPGFATTEAGVPQLWGDCKRATLTARSRVIVESIVDQTAFMSGAEMKSVLLAARREVRLWCSHSSNRCNDVPCAVCPANTRSLDRRFRPGSSSCSLTMLKFTSPAHMTACST
jgi:SpoVK/Ycf46/Vps4 family AAA+-type ATPase